MTDTGESDKLNLSYWPLVRYNRTKTRLWIPHWKISSLQSGDWMDHLYTGLPKNIYIKPLGHRH